MIKHNLKSQQQQQKANGESTLLVHPFYYDTRAIFRNRVYLHFFYSIS
jgi:hypothetical protein